MLHFMPNTVLLCCSNCHLWAIKLFRLFACYANVSVSRKYIILACNREASNSLNTLLDWARDIIKSRRKLSNERMLDRVDCPVASSRQLSEPQSRPDGDGPTSNVADRQSANTNHRSFTTCCMTFGRNLVIMQHNWFFRTVHSAK